MKLFYCKGACSLVVRIVLNELGIAFEDEAVDLRKKITASGDDYRRTNPKGAVPAIRLDNGEVITENQVILQYLTDTTPGQKMLAAVGDLKRYRTLEWLNYISTELHKSFGLLFNPNIPQELKSDVVVPLIMMKFSYINDHLQSNSYLMGDQVTLPDAYLYVMMLWANNFKMDFSSCPHLSQFMTIMQSRPSVIKSLKEEGL